MLILQRFWLNRTSRVFKYFVYEQFCFNHFQMANNPDISRVHRSRPRHDSVGGEDHVMGGHVEGALFCLENPLLDMIANVSKEFLDKYSLNKEDCILSNDLPISLFEEMATQFSVTYVPGGAALNSLRIAQWLIGVPKATTFIGCINKDKFGEHMERIVREEGVHALFQYDSAEPTGTCAVCLTGQDRSLVAYLGAAKHFSIEHLRSQENRAYMEKATYFYSSSFPMTVCPAAILEIATFAAANDRMFVYNLSAPFLCREYHEAMKAILPYVDVLFGNDSEAAAYSEQEQWGLTDLRQILLQLAQLPKANGKVGRMVVCTQGAEPTLVIREGVITEHPVIPIDKKDIVDTNGAGDAFVGGFLAQLVQGGKVADCIRSANYAANYIIQQSGCQLPDKPNFSNESTGF